MALYSDTTYTWTTMPSTWAGCGFTWFNPDGTGASTGTLDGESDALDLGEIKWFVPTSRIVTINQSSSPNINTLYAVSDDDITYTSYASPGAFQGRYVKTKVEIDLVDGYEGLSFITTTANFDTITRTYASQDTSTYGGATGARTLDLSNDFSKVMAMTAVSTTGKVLAPVLDFSSNTTLTFDLIDLDSYGKVSVDDTVNITVIGLPATELDTDTGNVTIKE